ncbi:endothelin-converting enzyme homolog [Monomorium pharaonis]|uniref:endothelin-converting enzyme homolog n=1 Tax=Monomorium pharaonis TaxID=307658 RepID=UPI00063F9AEB|nr:endothelin-converting enzyme homolog [Monomorium pharaonis]
MRRFILLAFISILLMKNVTPSKNRKYSSNLAWLFGLNNKPNENKEENKEESKDKNEPIVCQTQECKKIARIMSENMDKSVDPCDDFYEYACGKWPEHNPIPEGMDSWNMFYSSQVKVINQIKEIFDEGPKDDDLLAIKLAKKWYTVCIDTDTMDRRGLEPVVFTLSRIGGWPMIMEPDEWNEQEYSWQKVDDQYMRLTGRNAFHDVDVTYYSWNDSRKIVHIDTPHLPPKTLKLWVDDDEEEEKQDKSEDPSNEENQSDENDSQEPGSEGEDHDESGNNSNDVNNDAKNDDDDDIDSDDNDDDDDDDDDHDEKSDDDNNDNDNDRNKQDDDKNAKKVGMKKSYKFAKNKKVGHGRKIKSNTHSKKNENHKLNHKKERIKRRAMPTHVHEKLHARKNKKHRVKQARVEVTTPKITTEVPIDEDNYIKQYANYISKVGRALAKTRGVKVSEEHMNKDIEDMIKFQTKLYEITLDDSDDEEMTLNDFQEWYNKKKPKTVNSAIDWVYKIGELFDEAHVTIKNDLDDLDLEIGSIGYFENLVALLDETSSRTIVNYIHWNFLSKLIRTTISEMRELYYAWEGKENTNDAKIMGILVKSFRCAKEIEMHDILAYEYVRNYFSDEILTTASDMIDDIQKEVEYQIKKSEWMDEDTKDFVLAKLVNMEKFIGYPDWYKNNTVVKRYFQGLIVGNSYYENTLSYERYSKWKGLRRLMQNDEDEDDELMTISPVMVNAFFAPDLNSIALSAADFQSPLFAYGRPQAINYGIVGTIMGHEVNHGFDNDGYRFDKNGHVVEWLSAMARAYSKRAECFVDQFNNYSILKNSNYTIKDYGNQTAGENIADTMGLEAAFRAYRRRERECGNTNTVLPGHEQLSNDQLFFLSFANLWCETETNTAEAKYDPHSVGRLRVIGTLSNAEDFAIAYNCPTGSVMNPEKKCHIWK